MNEKLFSRISREKLEMYLDGFFERRGNCRVRPSAG